LDEETNMVRYFKWRGVDTVNQTFGGWFIFRTFRGEELLEEVEEPFEMGYYTYPQLELLFRVTGFEVIERFGNFDRQPLKHGAPNMIYLMRKPG
jgi:hypothetical protein